MTPDNEGAPAVAEAHPTDSIPVDVVHAEPLVVAKEAPSDGDADTPAPDAAAAGDAAAPDGTQKPGKPPKLPEWAQKRFDDLAAEKRISDREAKRLADELAALKAPKPEPAATPTAADDAAARAAAPKPDAQFGGYKTQADFDAAVAAEASRREMQSRAIEAQTRFNENSNKAFESGKTAFGDEFANAVQNLHQVGLLPYADAQGNVRNNEILEMVLATDDPAKVLYDLGSNPDRAAAIVRMAPNARAMELAKLAFGTPGAKPTPVPLSNAPRPVSPVDGSARISAAPSDNDDDETFFRKREAELAARRV